jgi:acetyl-CoA acetyltransferase
MKAVISAYARSPFHFAKKGGLAEVRPDTLAAGVVRGLLQRTELDPALLEDIILGCAYPEASQGNNVARIVGLLAGLPHEVGGMTVNRFCGSSMQAVHIAAAQIEAGMGEAFLCVGVESMTMVPQGGFNFSPNPELQAGTDAYISMGETAENVAQRWNVSRADQEALRSSRTARPPPRAQKAVWWARSCQCAWLRARWSMPTAVFVRRRLPKRWRASNLHSARTAWLRPALHRLLPMARP